MSHVPTPEGFRSALFEWHKTVQRPMPWKGERDPYRIWISEIILQQTRVEQGRPYYDKFITAFPTIEALAGASEQVVLKLWEGLGYYSRARNLLRCAQVVRDQFNGYFPETLPELLQLPGIGPYTAAAIASFAFQIPVAAVDGNVERILSRIWGLEVPVNSPAGKKQITSLAMELLDPLKPGLFNQAMMDFGALQCLPRNPICNKCPFRECCTAYLTQRTGILPVKVKKSEKKQRFFHYLIIRSGGEVYVRQRPSGDIWASLWEFPLIESTSIDLSQSALTALSTLLQMLPQAKLAQYSRTYRQTLTHQQIAARFWTFQFGADTDVLPEVAGWQRMSWETLRTAAFPGIIRSYLEDRTLILAV
jgi:A/G-specific adenine glycosylase